MTKLSSLFLVAAIVGAVAVTGCGEATQAAGGSGGAGGAGGDAGSGGSAGDPGSGGAGGVGGIQFEVCVQGLCMEDPDLAISCQETFDACVGRGHYSRCCRMDADRTCDVFGETGPY